MRLPSSICSGAFSHLSMNKSTHAQSVCLRTAPASVPRPPNRIERRFVGSISIGVIVEVRLHERLQEPLDHRLSNAVGNRRNPEWPSPAVSLRYVYPSHRRRIVTARRHSVPELVEVVRKISLEVRNRLPVDARRTLVGSNPLVGFPYFPFRNVERLCSIQGVPPIAGWPPARAEQRNPFGPAPLQSPQS